MFLMLVCRQRELGQGAAVSHGHVKKEVTKPALWFLPLNEVLCCFVSVEGPLTVVVDKSYPCCFIRIL